MADDFKHSTSSYYHLRQHCHTASTITHVTLQDFQAGILRRLFAKQADNGQATDTVAAK